ncbi:unnamed protein product [Dimorphilus gyrociliatus]|uniref:Protein kinase domain-containing protein n=1 Tax=Dimorphilus gyrociliatus TaxID=2664684 RepID=A0A7I8VDE5_9ANNE|nr:unnamed protein product [Dimorphilus gyrociliatus]
MNSNSHEHKKHNPVDLVVGRSVRTKLIKRLNGGSFGDIWLGEILKGSTEGMKVAVKLELQSTQTPQLMNESQIYDILQGGPGIPTMIWHGLYEPIYTVLVLDLLGPSLQDAFVYCDKKFTLKTGLMIMDQCLETLEFVHRHHVIHRDIKPDNWVLGSGGAQHKLYLIDFGLGKRLRRPSIMGSTRISRSLSMITHPLVGTVRYASIGAHLGHEETRRDDLESLSYMFLYLTKGSLPWQGLKASNREERLKGILEAKQTITSSELAEGLPKEISSFVEQCRHQTAYHSIDHNSAREFFKTLANREGIIYDNNFDWIIKQKETNTQLESHTRSEIHHSS